MEKEPIKVWEWSDAPEEFRALSTHGGDEDWVVFVPYSRTSGARRFEGYLWDPDRFYVTGWGWGISREISDSGFVLIFAHS